MPLLWIELQQRAKACLLKMVVAGECFVNLKLLHDDERRAIRKRPIFVRSAAKQVQSVFKQGPGCRLDLDARRLAQVIDEVYGRRAIYRVANGV
jgi:hypothetical protein